MSLHVLSSRRRLTLLSAAFALTLFLLLLLGSYNSARLQSAQAAVSNRLTSITAGKPYDLLDDIANATLGFQSIFVINLASRTDRKDAGTLAAALTGLDVEFVQAVRTVDEKAQPPGWREAKLNGGGAGAWRSHMNVIRTIVEQNISSALILEDDADWDIRIKSQMRDFAKASRLLLQPLPGTEDEYLDPTWPRPNSWFPEPPSFEVDNRTLTTTPTTSPYGDLSRWGMLWLGHCGCRFPWANDKNVPIGRAIIPDDETVPARQHINIEFGDTQLVDGYPDHTRVVARSRVNTCTLAYAVSQDGARRMLYEFGVHKITDPLDMMYRALCDGVSGRELMTCLSPQPALFNHHRPAGPKSAWSDISGSHGNDSVEIPFSTNIRWATRVNFPKLVNGHTDYIDSYPDE
ncbi:glycosyltransferase family 25 protein [Cercospora zeae-maydis SCOH1-5]|uniref:Glycosyltransferase family 25 protein n=1 Tax=Cercospora zeae-maydis SCOH1-5 TaxID=717836 RepID=A0A6A6EZ95_9PEZI|nr:glycosyltransferase family 25 protein [Cercospora zeae-maydis SCOH1-5]